MKYLLLVCLIVMLAGCVAQSAGQAQTTNTSNPSMKEVYNDGENMHIKKFRDGDVICYTYWEQGHRGGISCLREATSSAGR